MTIKIYSVRLSAPSRAVLMLAKQLKLDLEVTEVDFDGTPESRPEFAKKNPTRNLPTIEDDGYVLWESTAILQYLCNKHAPDSCLYHKDPVKRSVVDRWLNFNVQLLLAQGDAVFIKQFSGVEPTEQKVQILKEQLKGLDTLIGDNKYLDGHHLTIADIALLATTYELFLFDYDLSEYPNFRRYQSGLRAELPYFDEINVFEKSDALAQIEKMKAFRQRIRANK